MIRVFIFLSLSLLIAVIFVSCNQCNYVDCASDNYDGQFRIVSATTGKDLVFGSNGIYNKSQIKFYAVKGGDTTFFDYHPVNFPNIGYDSILFVRFYPKTDVAYMQLSNGDVDTLAISFVVAKGSKCCGDITEIASFRYNNLIDIPGDKGTQELKK